MIRRVLAGAAAGITIAWALGVATFGDLLPHCPCLDCRRRRYGP